MRGLPINLLKIFAVIILLFSTHLYAACVAVMPTAQGSGAGTSWTNAIAYSSLAGSNFVRGDTYYFADGNYGNTLSITTAASGTTTIILKKAQSYDYGRTSDGCSNDISAGWNASTMGASQAAWYSPTCSGGCNNNGIVNVGSGGYITINGNGTLAANEVGCGGVEASPPTAMTNGPPTPSNCGFLISDFTCTSTATDGCNAAGGEIRGGGANILWEKVEWFGQGLNSASNNNSEPYFWFANGGVLTGVTITNSYIHNMGTTAFTVVTGGWNNGSFDHNYAWGEFDGSVNHGESVQLQGANSGSVIHHNIWRDQQTNGDVVSTDTGGNALSFSIYDNADICSVGGTSTTCRHNDGSIGCFGTGICTILAYNNTWSYPSECGYNIGGGSGSIAASITLNNNLFYNCSSVATVNGAGGTNTIDYNSYLCSGKSAVGSHDVSVSSSCPNPFTNINLGAQLASDNADWNNRVSLGSPYDTLDLYGNAFTIDRGAAQFILNTTTVTISSTVAAANLDRPGINLGGIASYGSQQLLKSLNYAYGGSIPGEYYASTFSCSSGGTQSTTNWYNNITNASGFPTNFWVGATFTAINAATGTSYGSGTITASTSNVSAGANFTLSPAISSGCSSANNDVIIVRLLASNSLEAPNFIQNVCSGATYNTSDTSPSSTNTIQSLQMPTSCVLTNNIDATVANRTNTNGQSADQVNFININGSYNATFKAKCAAPGCSLTFTLGRLGGTTYVGSTTVNPTYNASNGVGWTTYNYPFTGTETGSQANILTYQFTCTGSCLLQDDDVVEASTLAGNTTVFRDAVVWELEQIHPGSIRYMDASQWCSDVADQIAATGNRRWCSGSAYLPQYPGQAIGYDDVLALGNVVGSDVFITVGQLNGASDWTTLIGWLNTSGWIATYAASGHKIYLEDGNETWNSGVQPSLYNGNGAAYGYTLGVNMAAAKAASGYNSSVIQLVGNGWTAPNQSYGAFGWLRQSMQYSGCTSGVQSGCPNFVDLAPYMLNYLGAFNTSGSNVSTTGAPFLDEWAENSNLDSVTSPPSNAQSMYESVQYANTNYGVSTAVYEVNESTLSGITATQLQLNQITGSVGQALSTAEHVLLMQRDSGVIGPIHVFTLAEPYTGYTCGGCGVLVPPLWGSTSLMSTGPGQTAGSANVDRPLSIALRLINNAIGSNNNLMSVTQSGTPTFNYTADQDSGGTPTILANSAVPYVNCFTYANTAKTSWTTICFNRNLSATEGITLAGAGAPLGSVTQTLFGNSNSITDNNENTYLGVSSIPPVVTLPSATTTSGTSYTIPAASMMILTYGSSIPSNASVVIGGKVAISGKAVIK